MSKIKLALLLIPILLLSVFVQLLVSINQVRAADLAWVAVIVQNEDKRGESEVSFIRKWEGHPNREGSFTYSSDRYRYDSSELTDAKCTEDEIDIASRTIDITVVNSGESLTLYNQDICNFQITDRGYTRAITVDMKDAGAPLSEFSLELSYSFQNNTHSITGLDGRSVTHFELKGPKDFDGGDLIKTPTKLILNSIPAGQYTMKLELLPIPEECVINDDYALEHALKKECLSLLDASPQTFGDGRTYNFTATSNPVTKEVIAVDLAALESFDFGELTGGTVRPGATCESENNNVSWLLCPIVEGSAENIDGVMGYITRLLDFDVGEANSSNGIYNVWSAFKNISSIMFVLVFLVIIYAQATGSLLDAYSVKKMLPRVVISAIAVQLSFFLSSFMINITNDLGSGLYLLIENILNINLAGGQYGSIVLGVVAGAALVGGGAFIGLFAITPIVLGLLIMIITVLFTLIFRTTLLTVLVILSPLAFVTWTLPGTEKYFKLWWQNFSKLLLMYPMIILLIEAGRIMAVASSGGNADNIGFMGMIYMFAPWLMIPFTFKFSGGAMAAIGSYSDKFKSGAKERAHRRAEPKLAQRKQDFFAGARSTGGGKGSKFINAVGGTLGAGPSAWGRRVLKRDKNAINVVRGANAATAAAARGDEAALKYYQPQEKVMAAMAFGDDYVDDKIANAETEAEKASWEYARSAAHSLPQTESAKLFAMKALMASGRMPEEGTAAYETLARGVSAHTGAKLREFTDEATGETSILNSEGKVEFEDPDSATAGHYKTVMNEMQFLSHGSGRFDLGGINDGKGYDIEGGWDRLSTYELGSKAKKPAFKAMQSRIDTVADSIATDADGKPLQVANKDAETAMRHLLDFEVAKGSATDENNKQMNDIDASESGQKVRAWYASQTPEEQERIRKEARTYRDRRDQDNQGDGGGDDNNNPPGP